MLKRMVIGLPRSGTTWAANWLTYGGEVCVHDPLYYTHYSEWSERYTAVSCTGIHDWPLFVQAQTCPVLVLHRPMAAIRKSLAKFDTERQGAWLREDAADDLWRIGGPNIRHVRGYDLFMPAPAASIWRFLEMPTQFDAVRHAELVRMRIEPASPCPADADPMVHHRLMAELRERGLYVTQGDGVS